MSKQKTAFLVVTRWFGVLGPCQYIIQALNAAGYSVFVLRTNWFFMIAIAVWLFREETYEYR